MALADGTSGKEGQIKKNTSNYSLHIPSVADFYVYISFYVTFELLLYIAIVILIWYK